ncbi:unnamed protein product, partial [Closterium sp. NIES-54]
VIEADKYAIMRRCSIPARDLRILDPLLSYPSTLLGREQAIVVNLEHIKCIIMAEEVLLLNWRNFQVARVVEELKARLPLHLNAAGQQVLGHELIPPLTLSPPSTSLPAPATVAAAATPTSATATSAAATSATATSAPVSARAAASIPLHSFPPPPPSSVAAAANLAAASAPPTPTISPPPPSATPATVGAPATSAPPAAAAAAVVATAAAVAAAAAGAPAAAAAGGPAVEAAGEGVGAAALEAGGMAWRGPNALPFEFRALEVCLESACGTLDAEVSLRDGVRAEAWVERSGMLLR